MVTLLRCRLQVFVILLPNHTLTNTFVITECYFWNKETIFFERTAEIHSGLKTAMTPFRRHSWSSLFSKNGDRSGGPRRYLEPALNRAKSSKKTIMSCSSTTRMALLWVSRLKNLCSSVKVAFKIWNRCNHARACRRDRAFYLALLYADNVTRIPARLRDLSLRKHNVLTKAQTHA